MRTILIQFESYIQSFQLSCSFAGSDCLYCTKNRSSFRSITKIIGSEVKHFIYFSISPLHVWCVLSLLSFDFPPNKNSQLSRVTFISCLRTLRIYIHARFCRRWKLHGIKVVTPRRRRRRKKNKRFLLEEWRFMQLKIRLQVRSNSLSEILLCN